MKANPLQEFEKYKFHNVLPGNFMITKKKDEVISTLLGSCVAACIRCSETGIGVLTTSYFPRQRENR